MTILLLNTKCSWFYFNSQSELRCSTLGLTRKVKLPLWNKTMVGGGWKFKNPRSHVAWWRKLEKNGELLCMSKTLIITLWTENPWKSCEFNHGKFMGIYKRILIAFSKDFLQHETLKKAWKKLLKKPLRFHISWPLKLFNW